MINLNRFDLAALRLYVAVVDARSLTAGADRFGISLAAASIRIAVLEQHCGMALLQRSQRGVTATPNGQTPHRHAIEVVSRLEQLALALEDFHTGTAGHLRLWANPSAFGGFLPRMLAQYAGRHPDVRVDLENALSEEAVRAVTIGTAEVAIIGDNTPTEGLETLVADVDNLVLIAPAAHPLIEAHAATTTPKSASRPSPTDLSGSHFPPEPSGDARRWCDPVVVWEYEGTSHFQVTASSAKIGVRTSIYYLCESEAP